jgi:type VI secretion system protein ImpF
MATSDRVDRDQPLAASILDRLLDADALAAAEPLKSRRQYLADLRSALRRDLEDMLNTHQSCMTPPPELTDLNTSLINYGIPHFLGLQIASEAAREQFRAEIEVLLRRFEPRFKRVSVTLVEASDDLDRTLRFRIDALIYAEPDFEPISFDSMIEPIHRRFSVANQDD